MTKIAVVVGSLRKDSFNLRLAKALSGFAATAQVEIVTLHDVPLFNQDEEKDPPKGVVEFKNKIKSADAVLFVTPEYNRSVPGVLKNSIDWGTRPYGTSVWTGKPAAIAGASPGAIGTAVAQAHLRSILTNLGMHVMGQPEIYLHFQDGMIDENGKVGEEKTEKFLKSFVEKFTAWVGTATTAKAA